MTTQQPNTAAQDTTAASGVQNKIYPEGQPTPTDGAAPAKDAAPATPPADAAKPDGDKKTADAPKEEPKKDEPAKFDLKLPEGSILDKTHLEAVTSYAKEKGLKPEQAQEILDRDSNLLKSYAETQQKMFESQISDWSKQAEADKEIGGTSFKENVHLAHQVAKKFGSPELVEGLNTTGFGNHPELIRLLVRVGKAMDNDKLVLPNAQAGSGKKSMEEVFYGSKQS